MDTKEDDYIEHLFVAMTHDYLLFFTNRGQGLPGEGARAAQGKRQPRAGRWCNLLPLRQDESVTAVIDTRDYSRGQVPGVCDAQGSQEDELDAYDTCSGGGIIALKCGRATS